MTLECRDDIIVDLQCKYSSLAHEASEKLSKASRGSDCKVRDMKLVRGAIRRLYRYQAFEQDLTFLTRFDITRTDENPLTIEIDIGGVTLSHTGSGDAQDLAQELAREAEDNTQSPNYRAWSVDNKLYIYSYDNGTSFGASVSVTVTQSSDRDNSVSKENLEDSTEELINSWNCLTKEELCSIIRAAYELTPENC